MSSEWLAQQLWQLFPFVLAATFLALSIAAAGVVYLVLARKLSIRPSVAIPSTLALGGVVLSTLVVTWSAGVVVPAPGPKPFEAGAWQAKPWARWGMAQDLVASERLLGAEREEVDSLLGHHNGSYSTPEVAYYEQEAWLLHRPQDVLMPISPELVVVYGDGRVARAWIEPGLTD